MTIEVLTRDKKNPSAPALPICIASPKSPGEFFIEARAFKLVFVRSGLVTAMLDGHEVVCRPPCILCLNEVESVRFPAGADAVAICFLPELLNGSLRMESLRGGPKSLDVSAELDLYWAEAYLERRGASPRPIPLGSLSASRLDRWLERLRVELDGQVCKFWKAWARSYLSEMLFVLGETYHAIAFGLEAPPFKPLRDEDPMAAVVTYLHEQYSRSDLTVGLLCKTFATNKTSLQRDFKEYTGRSLVSYLRHHRLSIARELLESSDQSISEIAWEVGYNDLTGFERAFAKSYGLAPRKYRLLIRGELPPG